MKPEDDSLLTAYLDGELDPDERPAIEAALLSSPSLSGRLVAMAAVRDAVARLPRPALPVDLSPALVRRIGDRRPGEFVRIGPWRLTHARLLAGLSAAALILLALTLGVLSNSQNFPPRPRRPEALTRGAPPREAPTPHPEPRSIALRTPPAPEATRPAETVREPVTASSGDDAGRRLAREQEHVRQMLDCPRLRKVFVVTDKLGGAARYEVDRLIHETPRAEPAYGQITVSQGIVIDPRHPDQATVFAVVLNDRELRYFQEKLSRSFPGAVEEEPADPAVVTQLTDIGQVALMPGTPAAELDLPDSADAQLALRDTPGSRSTVFPEVPGIEATSGAPGGTNRGGRAAAANGARGARRGPRPAESGATVGERDRRQSSTIVLVWVTSREPRDRGRP